MRWWEKSSWLKQSSWVLWSSGLSRAPSLVTLPHFPVPFPLKGKSEACQLSWINSPAEHSEVLGGKGSKSFLCVDRLSPWLCRDTWAMPYMRCSGGTEMLEHGQINHPALRNCSSLKKQWGTSSRERQKRICRFWSLFRSPLGSMVIALLPTLPQGSFILPFSAPVLGTLTIFTSPHLHEAMHPWLFLRIREGGKELAPS